MADALNRDHDCRLRRRLVFAMEPTAPGHHAVLRSQPHSVDVLIASLDRMHDGLRGTRQSIPKSENEFFCFDLCAYLQEYAYAHAQPYYHRRVSGGLWGANKLVFPPNCSCFYSHIDWLSMAGISGCYGLCALSRHHSSYYDMVDGVILCDPDYVEARLSS